MAVGVETNPGSGAVLKKNGGRGAGWGALVLEKSPRLPPKRGYPAVGEESYLGRIRVFKRESVIVLCLIPLFRGGAGAGA